MKTVKTVYVVATKDIPRQFQMSGDMFTDDITHAGYFYEKETAQSHVETMFNTSTHCVIPLTLTYSYPNGEVI